MKFKMALVQMNSRSNKEENLEKAVKLVDEAGRDGADLVALPECFNYLGATDKSEGQAEPIPGPTTECLAELARKHGMYVHCGSILETSGKEGMSYNTTAFLDRRGEIMATYRKIHLFDVDVGGMAYRESDDVLPGEELVLVETDIAKIGLTICYDMRFPELYRILTSKGAQLILVPAAFTLYTGKDHWEPLLRARAIENQVFVAAPAQVGSFAPGKITFGNSLLVDPWGIPIARASEREQVVSAWVDLGLIDEVKAKVPAWNHRVPKVYQGLL